MEVEYGDVNVSCRVLLRRDANFAPPYQQLETC